MGWKLCARKFTARSHLHILAAKKSQLNIRLSRFQRGHIAPLSSLLTGGMDLKSAQTSTMAKSVRSTDITLTDQETKLRTLLLDVARMIDESKAIKQKIEIRFAGGWVRDKLLGIPSNDIDSAINVMTGSSFCLKMKEYLSEPKNLEKNGLQKKDIGNIHEIAANPEKSKHLETATVKMLGLDVDFVNLRKETYSSDSRNPLMEFGSPEDDALRRDATINALFYNLHTQQVEDLTGGLRDMDANIIRTPLEPVQTFTDDPLRILRLIRFACRLSFQIEESCEVHMADPPVLEALRVKISRERVGVEIGKMFKDQDPRRALQYFDKLQLYHTIFTDPTRPDCPTPNTERWSSAYDCLNAMRSILPIYQRLVPNDVNKDEATHRSWIMASLAPWANVPNPPNLKSGKLARPYAALVAEHGIKERSKVCDLVTGAVRNRADITVVKEDVVTGSSYLSKRDVYGLAIRRWNEFGGDWKIQVLYAILVESMESDADNNFEKLFSSWQLFLDRLDELGIMDAPSWKHIVDGKQLSKALGVKAGIWMKEALNVSLAWSFRNPGITDPAEAINEVRQRAAELQIPIVENGRIQ